MATTASASPRRRRRPKSSSGLNIQRVGEGSAKFNRIFIYGPPGSGKTPLVGSSKKMKTFMIECDHGDESAALAGSTADKVHVDNYDQLTEVYDYFHMGPGCEEYDLLVWDTVSRFQERGLDQIMAELVATPGKQHRKLWAPDKGEYGQNMNRLSLHAREIVSLPIHTIFVGWEMIYEDPETGDTKIYPWVAGRGMAPKFCGYVNYVFRMEIEGEGDKEDRYLTTSTDDGRYYTKDRTGAVGRLRHPSIDRVFARMEEARNTGPKQKTRTTNRKAS